MLRMTIMDQFLWIKKFINSSRDRPFRHISDVVPDCFDEYYFIHERVGIIGDFPFDAYPGQIGSLEELNQSIRLKRLYGLFSNPDSSLFQEITLAALADRFRLPYSHRLLDEMKPTPAITVLWEQTKTALESSLSEFSGEQRLFLYVRDYERFFVEQPIRDTYESITVKEYMQIQDRLGYDAYSYLFPEELRWCLVTIEDGPMFLCINKELRPALEAAFSLELFRVEYASVL